MQNDLFNKVLVEKNLNVTKKISCSVQDSKKKSMHILLVKRKCLCNLAGEKKSFREQFFQPPPPQKSNGPPLKSCFESYQGEPLASTDNSESSDEEQDEDFILPSISEKRFEKVIPLPNW